MIANMPGECEGEATAMVMEVYSPLGKDESRFEALSRSPDRP